MDPSLTALPISTTSNDSPAGIHCANPECRTRAGERSRGHQSCRALLCGHCCQNAARLAAEAGEQRPVCKVHARRVHTGHKPVPKEQQPQQPEASTSTSGAANVMPIVNGMNNMAWTGPGLGEPEELHDLLDKRARLEQSLKRSLTMVIWYRNGCEPLRIAHEVTTFPLFQLQDFPELVNELGLLPSSYIDSYNTETGQWEQHKITTVRTVGQDQRVLYRLRPSLLDSLTDCPCLEQELSLQPPPTALLAKRHAEPFTPAPLGKQPKVLSNSTPIRAPAVPATASTVVQSWDSPVADNSASPSSSNWGLLAPQGSPLSGVRTSPGATALHTSGAEGTSTGSPSNTTKRWPTDYTVHEITTGFDAMAALVKADPSARQKSAFEKVFPPCRYVKSTVGRAKLYWKRASQEIRDHFLALPKDDPRGRWTHFVHLMDGRLVIEVGKDKGGAAGEGEVETADEDEQVNVSGMRFGAPPINQPQLNVQSPPTLTTHSSLALNRQQQQQPPMSALLSNHSPLTHHASAPAMPMAGPFTIGTSGTPCPPGDYTSAQPSWSTPDRNININRSSSSLSGAITIPNV